MRILLKFADSLNYKRVGKELFFSRNFRLSLGKRPEKPLVKTQPLSNSSSLIQVWSILYLL